MEKKTFNILSIDGGGIRGVFPAMLLANLESELNRRGNTNKAIWQHFDLIVGTSTGGILAIALALGISAKTIHQMYVENAFAIFGNKRSTLSQLWQAAHDKGVLEQLLKQTFDDPVTKDERRLNDCKTNICIPIYDMAQGKPRVLKNKYHPSFVTDYHIPAYLAALATSSAPTYFNPLSTYYEDLHGNTQQFTNKVDGGVFANNPTLLAIVEAQKAFGKNLGELRVLSIGTGVQKFADSCDRSKWGLGYWMRKRKPLIELFMQGQSQQVENLVGLLHKGIGQQEAENFGYLRINTELDSSCCLKMDEVEAHKLKTLGERGTNAFQQHAENIFQLFIQ